MFSGLLATPADRSAFLALAAEVEDWFGPMVREPAFHAAVDRGIAHVAVRAGEVIGGLLTGGAPPVYRLTWLVVAADHRSHGAGSALVARALAAFHRPCQVDVETFGPDHPGARSRGFYERQGFHAGAAAPPGPDGGSRQWFHQHLL